jgi:hypothetical protein
LAQISELAATGPSGRADAQRQDDMKTNSLTETERAVAVERDDGRHAARVVMVSLGLLSALILLLQAITL